MTSKKDSLLNDLESELVDANHVFVQRVQSLMKKQLELYVRMIKDSAKSSGFKLPDDFELSSEDPVVLDVVRSHLQALDDSMLEAVSFIIDAALEE